jgi:GNAT superfamily N-acetyltransferase
MTTSLMRTRHATEHDVTALRCMLERCSPQTLEHRFHGPLAPVPDRLLRELVNPPLGWSLLAEQGAELVGHGCAAPLSTTSVEIGLLVDDAFQGTGVGARLVRDLALGAVERGFASMRCSVAPDNLAVLPTVRKAGLEARSAYVDGIVELDITLPAAHRDGSLPLPA